MIHSGPRLSFVPLATDGPLGNDGGMSALTVHLAIRKTLAVIMGGGAGTRLFPLTKDRSKPAVPLAGKYRIVDIPISNCLNSGLKRIFLLTQFNSTSLHGHISLTYKFDEFSTG